METQSWLISQSIVIPTQAQGGKGWGRRRDRWLGPTCRTSENKGGYFEASKFKGSDAWLFHDVYWNAMFQRYAISEIQDTLKTFSSRTSRFVNITQSPNIASETLNCESVNFHGAYLSDGMLLFVFSGHDVGVGSGGKESFFCVFKLFNPMFKVFWGFVTLKTGLGCRCSGGKNQIRQSRQHMEGF